MLRQLLTLLAVISGFTLAAEPVRALDANVVSMAQAAEDADCPAISTRPAELAQSRAMGEQNRKPCAQPRPSVWVPSVQLQADRARE